MIELRKYPFPYRAVLGCMSDCEETGFDEVSTLMNFLNTTNMTDWGQGIGLPLTTSLMFASSPSSTICLYEHEDEPSPVDGIRHIKMVSKTVDGSDWATVTLPHYIDIGWIDFMHSFCGGANADYIALNKEPFNRSFVQKWLQYVTSHNIKLTYYINHSASSSNLLSVDDDNSDPESDQYWVDLAAQAGFKFLEVGPSGTDPQYYRAYDHLNQGYLVRPIEFQDGTKAWTFRRCYHAGTAANTAPDWANETILNKAVSDEIFDCIGIHWGYQRNGSEIIKGAVPLLTTESIAAMRLLKEYNDDGRILVARPADMLQYDLARQVTQWTSSVVNGVEKIVITNFNDTQLGAHTPALDEIRGLTFYVDDPATAQIYIGDTLISESEICRNGYDHRYRKSVGIKWKDFVFPPNYQPITVRVVKLQGNDEINLPVYDSSTDIDGRVRIQMSGGIGYFNLVSENAQNASPIKVKVSEGIKCIEKLV